MCSTSYGKWTFTDFVSYWYQLTKIVHLWFNYCLWYLIFSSLYLPSLNLLCFIQYCFYSFTVASSTNFKGQLLAFSLCWNCIKCATTHPVKGEDTLLSCKVNIYQNANNILKPSICATHMDWYDKDMIFHQTSGGHTVFFWFIILLLETVCSFLISNILLLVNPHWYAWA